MNNMTQANRKRRRDLDEDNGEFTPLSKRINNLHINNLSRVQEGSPERLDGSWKQNIAPSPNYSEPSQGSLSCDGFSSSQSSFSAENSVYYENNKMLYNLHMERLQRMQNSYQYSAL